MYKKNSKSCHLKDGQRKRSQVRRLTSCVHRPVGCKLRAKQIGNCGRGFSKKVECSTTPEASGDIQTKRAGVGLQNDGDHSQTARLVSKWKISRGYVFRQLSFI